MSASEDGPGSGGVEDARGTLCPVPVIRLARRLQEAAPGTVVVVLADDPAAATDVPAFCRMRGHTYLGARDAEGGGTAHAVRRT